MYYSDDLIEEIRSRNDILDVVSSYVKLKRSGSTYFGLCPFHSEKTPSFSVTPRKQMFYCFGCHRGGSVFTFIQLYENATFQEAVRLLAERGGVALPQEDESAEARREHSEREQILEIYKTAATWFYRRLRSPEGAYGMQYFRERGLSDETMKRFGLGYSGRHGDALCRYLKEQGYHDEAIRKSGLASMDEKRGLYDRFFNRVMFPIMDAGNHVIGFGGRVLGDGKPKYLNSPENIVFNKRRNLYGLNMARRTREKQLILCEGYMDVIAMHQAGFSNAVASLGTALTLEQAVLLKRYASQVLISYDNDTAGVDAALRAIDILREAGLSVRILRLQPYKDPDEFIKAEGADAFRQRMDQAQNYFMFQTEIESRRHDLKDPEGMITFLKIIAGRIASFELSAEREYYAKAVAEAYEVRYDSLTEMVRSALTGGTPVQEKPRQTDWSRQEKPEESILVSQRMLLTWLTVYPSFFKTLRQFITPQDFSEGPYRRMAEYVYERMEQGGFNEAAAIDHFQNEGEEEAGLAAQLFHTDVRTDNMEDLKKAMRETIRKVAVYAMEHEATAGAQQDLGALQRSIERKKKLEQIGRVPIEL